MREMKDSHTEWLECIPQDWALSNIGALYSMRNTKVSDRDYQPLSVTMKGVVPQLETAAKSDAHDDRKLVKKGDFAINSRSDRRGSCGIADRDGSVSLINTILAPRSEMNPDYYNWLFHTSQFADEFYRWGHGIVDDLWTTRWQEMKKIEVPIPNCNEQEKIADYLDTACTKVDALIANQQTQIEKLKAYKQSLITEVVTHGLDPDAPMKDSGVEWIGRIPQGWEYLKSFYIYDNIGDVDHNMPNSVAEGVPYVMTGDLMDVVSKIDFEKCKKISQLDYEKLSKKITPNRGDIIFARYATIGTVCYVDVDKEFIVSYSCVTIKPNRKKADGKYLWFYYQSVAFLEEVKKLINSNTQANVGMESLYRANIIVPPLNEQKEIIAYLDGKCAKIDALIVIKQKKIEKLTEYKKSLIYEYVTGKKEVT
jgi:type I restriction enzyme, S subunit